MIYLVRRIWREFPTYERRAQVSILLALILLVVALLAALLAPRDARIPILFGVFGLIVAIEVAVLYANRSMVSAYTQAQRHYLAQNYAQAAATLEAVHKPLPARALTLLGNAYRQLGRLDESATVLYEALNKQQDSHSALYALGRTRMAHGAYADAAEDFMRALAAGAPRAVLFDLAEAQYRMGNLEAAEATLDDMNREGVEDDPPRRWLAVALHARITGAPLASDDLTQAALLHWQEVAARQADTPYGRDLARDLADWQRQLTELER